MGQATTNSLKSISRGRNLALIDLQAENWLRLKVIKTNSTKTVFFWISKSVQELFENDLVEKCSKCKAICLKINYQKSKNQKMVYTHNSQYNGSRKLF